MSYSQKLITSIISSPYLLLKWGIQHIHTLSSLSRDQERYLLFVRNTQNSVKNSRDDIRLMFSNARLILEHIFQL